MENPMDFPETLGVSPHFFIGKWENPWFPVDFPETSETNPLIIIDLQDVKMGMGASFSLSD